jgi:glycosyl hydrolase family 2
MPRLTRHLKAAGAAALAALALPAAASAQLPGNVTLSSGWEVRGEEAAPAPTQPPPPEESQPDSGTPAGRPVKGRASQTTPWRPTAVPSVFDSTAIAANYPGRVRVYRLRFRAPAAPRGFHWLLRFESVRRAAKVRLNGRLVGQSVDPYTPFQFEARGLRRNRQNTLTVVVDSRKDPRISEGWWNWGGIVRPVKLVPVGRAYADHLGLMSNVRCRGGQRCRAALLIDTTLTRRGRRPIKPRLTVRLRSPAGRVTKRTFKLKTQKARKRRVNLKVRVREPMPWSPDQPNLYSAKIVLRDRGQLMQAERHRAGLRSVRVRGGLIYLNGRRLNLRGASIHEDMPGRGAALTDGDMDRIVSDLKALGANVTRAHYLMNDRLLSRFDRAGIMVWNQAPVWQRDHRGNTLRFGWGRQRALAQVRRTVLAARSHPSVITHSVANELSFTPDYKPGTRRFLVSAQQFARDLDPTLPIAVDIKGRPGFEEQFTYHRFDILGINQYFGWYPWVQDFTQLDPFLREMNDLYPRQAKVMTEFGAEARPELADAPTDKKGGYAFQAMHAGRTLTVVDSLPFLSGAIYWTLREFEIYPGWTGGAGRRPPQYEPNTRHQKGVLTYEGARKPAWQVLHDRFRAIPLYR